jgi:hypothetical protein
MKTVKLGKTLTLIAASKLVAHSHTVSAQNTPDFGSKVQPDNPAPPLLLNQIGYPLDLISPPSQGLLDAEDIGELDRGSKLSGFADQTVGYIWTEELMSRPAGVQPPRIDFIISNVRNDRLATVYLAYSPRLAPEPLPLRGGVFMLDLESVEIIAGIELTPQKMQAFPNAFGEVRGDMQSLIIPVFLKDLNDPKLADNNMYFQAVVLPPGAGIEEAQASEVDHYIIERVLAEEAGSGSKVKPEPPPVEGDPTGGTEEPMDDSGSKGGKQ